MAYSHHSERSSPEQSQELYQAISENSTSKNQAVSTILEDFTDDTNFDDL